MDEKGIVSAKKKKKKKMKDVGCGLAWWCMEMHMHMHVCADRYMEPCAQIEEPAHDTLTDTPNDEIS